MINDDLIQVTFAREEKRNRQTGVEDLAEFQLA